MIRTIGHSKRQPAEIQQIRKWTLHEIWQKDFAGGILIVSHDKHLISATCNELLVVRNRTVKRFEGCVAQFRTGAPGPTGTHTGVNSEYVKGISSIFKF